MPEVSPLPVVEAEAIAPTTRAGRDWVSSELVAALLRPPSQAYLAIAVAALAVPFLCGPRGQPLGFVLWLLALAVVTGTRWWLTQRFSIARSTRKDRSWARRYGAILFLSGTLWALPVIFALPESPVRLVSLGILIAAVGAGEATLGAPVWWAYPAFAVAVGITLFVRVVSVALGSNGGAAELTTAGLTAGFLLATGMFGARLRSSLTETLTLRFHNENLASEFARAHQLLVDENEKRERVIRELDQRDRILRAVSFAAEHLLGSRSWDSNPTRILERLGEAAQVSHVYVVQHERTSDGDYRLENSFRWTSPRQRDPNRTTLFPADYPPWRRALRRGQRVSTVRSAATGEEGTLLDRHHICSIALFPIRVNAQWWGVLGFEDSTRERAWTEPELEALAASADMLGAAVTGIRTVEALRTSDDRFRLLAENTNDLVCLHRPDGRLLYLSPSSESLLGYLPHQLIGREPWKLAIEEDEKKVKTGLIERGREGHSATVAYRSRRLDGSEVWLESRIQPIHDDNNVVTLMATSTRDITDRKQAEEQLFREKELAQVTLKSIGDGVVTTDGEARVRYMNPIAERLAGVEERHARGLHIGEVLKHAGEGASTVEHLVQKAFDTQQVVTTPEAVELKDPQGKPLAVEVSAAPIQEASGATIGTVTVLRDVTSTQALAAQLTYQATHDSLTGLMNRREFEKFLEMSVQQRRRGEQDALCYLDLDQFKVVNDTCGHIAGDELLRQLAGVLQTKIRRSDVVARLGGDEFGILLTRCAEERASRVAKGICEAIRGFRFTWGDKIFQLGVSIGVVPITTPNATVTELLSAADAACYAAKDQGRNRVHMVAPDDRGLRHRKGEMEWVTQIHRALELNRFELHYQPILETSHEIVEPRRIEILLTMISEEGKRIPPGTFIPAAERFNTMPSIDRWVVRKSIETFADHWQQKTRHVKECFINLSGTSLTDPTFGEFVIEQLLEHRVPPGVLCFEITETAAITNLAEAKALMRELRGLGCRFALDDFGSGLSSFAYLRSLPVDFLKIDGIFVKDIHRDKIDYSIVESINKVGQELGLKTIAEFVETDEVLQRLVTLGVDYVQGYGLARPAPVEGLLEDLRVRAPAAGRRH